MTTRSTRHRARREAGVLAVIAMALLAAVLLVRQRPDGPDEVKIPIEALRSQFAELTLLDAQAGDPLPPRFVRAQASQLGKAVDATREQLDGLHPSAELNAARQEALGHARRLQQAVDAMRGSGTALPRATSAELEALAQRLKTQEESLRR
ncbi:MAG TPA: hypothetical protein VF169_20345 [Albitalea sp.]|uniref:hypothetical protein n=1 Tax=Piscinibacter sp. TaxID=1903157 RepID=UPI002ED4D639